MFWSKCSLCFYLAKFKFRWYPGSLPTSKLEWKILWQCTFTTVGSMFHLTGLPLLTHWGMEAIGREGLLAWYNPKQIYKLTVWIWIFFLTMMFLYSGRFVRLNLAGGFFILDIFLEPCRTTETKTLLAILLTVLYIFMRRLLLFH